MVLIERIAAGQAALTVHGVVPACTVRCPGYDFNHAVLPIGAGFRVQGAVRIQAQKEA